MKKIITILALLCLLPLCLGQSLSPESLGWHNDPGNDSCITFYSDQAIYSIKEEDPKLDPVIVLAENECGYALTGNFGIFFQTKDIQETKIKDLYQSTSSHIEIVERVQGCPYIALFDEKTKVGTCYYDDVNGMNILFRQEVKALNEKNFSWDEEKTVNDFFLLQKTQAPSVTLTGKTGFELSEGVGNVTIPTGKSYLKFSADLPKGSRQGFFIITFENNLKKAERTVLDPEYRVGIFDDFEDGDYDLDPVWSGYATTGTGSFTVNEASAKNGTYGVQIATAGNGIWGLQTIVSLATLDTWTWIQASDVTPSSYYSYQNAALGDVAVFRMGIDKFSYFKDGGYLDFTATPSDNTWYISRMVYDGSNTSYYIYDSSLALIESKLDMSQTASGDVIYVKMLAIFVNGTTFFDDTGYGDSTIPGASSPGQPDVNLLSIEGESLFGTLPFYSYFADGNLAVDFNVLHADNERITLDINYSLTATEGGGTIIYQDLNLTADYCPNQDWNTMPSTCSLDWNIAGMGDNNFYLLVSVSDGTNTDFNSHSSTIGIDNNAPVYIAISPFGDSFIFQDEANFWLNASDSYSGLNNCNYTSYFNGAPSINKTVDFNTSGFCPVTEMLGSSGSTAFVRYYTISDHAGNTSFTIHNTGTFARAFSQSADPENIREEDIGKALTYFTFTLLQAIGLAAGLILVFLLVRAILFR